MYKVVGVRKTGLKYRIEDGKPYDNIYLFVLTDHVHHYEHFEIKVGYRAMEIGFAREEVELIGANDWYDLIDREIEFKCAPIGKGKDKAVITAVCVIDK